MYFSKPAPASDLYHIFKDDNRSLCSGYAILNVDENEKMDVKGTETWSKGQDCKACFKKAKLNIE